MLTTTPSPLARQRREGADHGEGAAHICHHDGVEQRIVDGIEIAMGRRLGEARGIDEDVAAAIGLANGVGRAAHGRGVLQHDAHGAVAAGGQRRDHRVGARLPGVVADHDGRAVLGEHADRGGADAAAAAGHHRDLAGKAQ